MDGLPDLIDDGPDGYESNYRRIHYSRVVTKTDNDLRKVYIGPYPIGIVPVTK